MANKGRGNCDGNNENGEILESAIRVSSGMKRAYAFLTRAKKISEINTGKNKRVVWTRSLNNHNNGLGSNFQGWVNVEFPEDDDGEQEEAKSDVVDCNSDDDADEVMLISEKQENGIKEILNDHDHDDDLDFAKETLINMQEPKDDIRQAKSAKVDFSDFGDDHVNWDNGVSEKTNCRRFTRSSAKLKDLLETGLLEGLPVHYVCGLRGVNKPKEVGLRGEIRGSGILCFCAHCKGTQVVMPNQFLLLHASSGKNRPPDYIYLQNGKSLRDILNICKDASSSSDSLEVAIRNAIGLSQAQAKSTTFCDSLTESKDQTIQSTTDHIHTSDSPSLPVSSKKKLSGKCSRNKVQGKLTKKDLRLHKVVFESNLLADGTPLGYYVQRKKLLSGYKSGSGVFCYCCNKVVSPSLFQAHAGFASRRKHYLQIYTSDGVSLHEWALAIKRNWQSSTNQNDDVCSICEGVGELLCCDMCPRAFHQGCVNLRSIPEGTWYCRYCVNMLEKEKFIERNANAKAAGRVAGIDPVEEVKKRFICVICGSDSDVGGCALCWAHDLSESDFGPRTVIICDQCEKEYHVGCLKEHGMDDLQELSSGNWFCSRGCGSIHSALQQLVNDGEQMLPDFLLRTIKKKHEDKASEDNSDLNISWRLLHGKTASEESRKWLSGAVSVFHERFDPIRDSSESGNDLIPFMTYGRNNRDQDFGGMYCAILTVNSIVVSAGIFRIFGQEVAEIPLVATSNSCQGKGYFQSLLCCIENLLASVNVRNLVLPATHEAESMWKNKFGFAKIRAKQLEQYKKKHQMMIFLGTSVLQKRVTKVDL